MNATVQKTHAFDALPTRDGVTSRTIQNVVADTVHLHRTQHLSLHDRIGWTVRALCGTAWITQDGDLRDIVLEAGDTFRIDRNGTTLVSALGETRVSVTHDGVGPAVQRPSLRGEPEAAQRRPASRSERDHA